MKNEKPAYARAGALGFGARPALQVGVDEVGRGPLAGPVVAAACIVPEGEWAWAAGIRDSKKLSAKKREALAALIEEHWCVAVGVASVEEIDVLNIRRATFLAMRRAVEELLVKYREVPGQGLAAKNHSGFLGQTSAREPVSALVDGNALIEGLDVPQRAIVGGDGLVLEIGAASIVVKVYRDKLMAELDIAFPGYGWAGNAGYGTAEHLAALRQFGATVHHRRSFAPVRDVLEMAYARNQAA